MIDLTDEEYRFVARAAAAKAGFLPAFLSCLPYLGPVALFGGYGIAARDITAVALAFVCLVGLNLWWIQHQARSVGLFRTLCTKILAAGAVSRLPAAERPGSDDPRPADGAEQP